MISLLPSDDQRAILASIETLLDDQAPLDRLHGEPDDRPLLRALASFGINALVLDEDAGGMGADWASATLVFRELGRHLVTPSSAAALLAALMVPGATERQAIVDGDAKVSLAVPLTPDGAMLLIDARDADLMLHWERDTLTLASYDGADATPAAGIDETLPLFRAGQTPHSRVASADGELATAAQLLIAAMSVGLADRACRMAVDYAMTRHQFGRPIAEFQAIKHRCADMAVAAEAAWAQTIFAALQLDADAGDARRLAHAARLLATRAAITNAEANIQVHGGIGFTAEAQPHLLVRRAQLLARLGGERRWHVEQLFTQDVAA